MSVNAVMQKMIAFSNGSQHDICHFLKVYAYARTIGEGEGLDAETQQTLEIAAIVHDIACPLCREKYGRADGAYQQLEGMPLAAALLADTGLSDEVLRRVVYLVGHHHTLSGVDGLDYRILLEADFLVNADESGMSHEQIVSGKNTVFRTETGLKLMKAVYGV